MKKINRLEYKSNRLGFFWLIAVFTAIFSLAIQTVPVSAATNTPITLAEIAAHNTAANCWTAIDGTVYDITSFISNHPGGPSVAIICGIDGSQIFPHNAGYLAMIANLQIGVLSTTPAPTPDTTAPVISLNGNNHVTITAGTAFIDAGATATDNVDGTVNVATTGTVDSAIAGTYTLTYTAADAAGNTATETRTVVVEADPTPVPTPEPTPAPEPTPTLDTTPPVISLNGNSLVSILIGAAYNDAGATALDNIDGAVDVITSGFVNTPVAGTYTLTYTAADAAGNTATETRTVVVEAAPVPTPDPTPVPTPAPEPTPVPTPNPTPAPGHEDDDDDDDYGNNERDDRVDDKRDDDRREYGRNDKRENRWHDDGVRTQSRHGRGRLTSDGTIYLKIHGHVVED